MFSAREAVDLCSLLLVLWLLYRAYVSYTWSYEEEVGTPARARACALETVDAGTVEDVHLPMFVVVNDACIDVKILLLHLLLAPLLAPCHLLIQK